jgi:hypothetical protein
MVAYSYKARFVAPIRVGLGLPVLHEHLELGGYHPVQVIKPKRQTIRAYGLRRHVRPGETLQHYHAMRQPKCFKIGDARCVSVDDIRLFIRSERIAIRDESGSLTEFRTPRELDRFAGRDGFGDWADMRAFWLEEHDGKHLGPFRGVLVRWVPLQ